MFSKAYEIASSYTHPVVASMRFFDGSISCAIGSFVIVNNEGWIATAAHLIQPFIQYQKNIVEVNNYKKALSEINNNPSLTEKLKKTRKKQVADKSKMDY